MHTSHPMRRKTQQLSTSECFKVLQRATSGTLALIDKEGFPYALPLSYAFVSSDDSHPCTLDSRNQSLSSPDAQANRQTSDLGSLVFHSALTGHKIEALKHCSKASFCVIDADEVIPEKFTTAYRSVIIFGSAHIIDDKQRRYKALEALGRKYAPTLEEAMHNEIDSAFERTCVIELIIEEITGKVGKELCC